GLAQHHRAGGEEVLHHRGVVGGHKVVEHFRGAAGAHTLGAEDVLVGDGHATEGVHGIAAGAPGVRGGGALQGLAAGHGDEGVVGGVEALDAVEEVAGQLGAGGFGTGEGGAPLRGGLVVRGGCPVLGGECWWVWGWGGG